jgi:hypothetical protein
MLRCTSVVVFRLAPLLLIGGIVLASDAPPASPKSPAARAIVEKHDAAVKKAELAYKQAIHLADKQEAAEAEVAIRAAMNHQDLNAVEELNQIKKAAAEREAEDLTKLDGRAQTFMIYANKDWQPTIQVKKGQKIAVTAEGKWCYNTDRRRFCTADGYKDPAGQGAWGQLQACINGDDAFAVGSRSSFVCSTDGTLMFRMDDSIRSDNSGILTVSVTASN